MERWRRRRVLIVTTALFLLVVVSGYVLIRRLSLPGVSDARDSHVRSIELGSFLPTAPPGTLYSHRVRDECESDWFDRDPPAAWWEYTADSAAQPVVASYRQALLDAGWTPVGDFGNRFRKEFSTWATEVVVSADGTKNFGIYAYVVESDDCR